MSEKRFLDEQARAMLVQKHQLESANTHLDNMHVALDRVTADQHDNNAILDELLDKATETLDEQGVVLISGDVHVALSDEYIPSESLEVESPIQPLALLDTISLEHNTDWSAYLARLENYAARNDVVFAEDPFRELMSDSQRIALEKRVRDEFSLKAAACDKYDYMIAGTCGLIGGLVDIFFVGTPGTGALGQWADSQVDNSVMSFAKLCGWNGKEKDKGIASAIGYLERKFKVNYDHATSHATGGAVKNMSMSNHHIKSLGHSPDLVGLFFSILDQFSNTAHFVSDGKLIEIDTKTFELSGRNIVGKVFAGFSNWLGHLFSDMAGSSGGRGKPNAGRGSGIPMPFYSLLQFINTGSLKDKNEDTDKEYRRTFATISVKVFESGYDLRHGFAMAIPVLITELLTRLMWVVKQRFYHLQDWQECLPSASTPEVRRMLLIGHGTLCLIDGADAGLRSGGNIIAFMLRSNLIAWVKFGAVALKEVKACYMVGVLDIEAIDIYLDAEYARLMRE